MKNGEEVRGRNDMPLAVTAFKRRSAGLVYLTMLTVLFGASPLQAEHIVEFQLEASKLFDLVGDRLAEQEICYPDSFQMPGSSEDVILDHIELVGPMALQWSGSQLQIVVPVEIFTKAAICIAAPVCEPYEYTPAVPLAMNLLLNVTADLNGSEVQLCVALASILPIPAGSFPTICADLGIVAALAELVGDDRTLKVVDVGTNSAMDRLAIRLEFNDPANLNAPPATSWDSFYLGQIAPTAAGMDWSLFISKQLFLDAVAARFTAELEVISGPVASWTPLQESGGQVNVDLTADFDVDLCPNSIGADASVETKFWIDSATPDVIKSHGTIETDVIDSDAALCAFLTGNAPGTFPMILTAMAIYASQTGPEDDDFPDDCTLDEEGESFDCQNSVDLPSVRLSTFNSSWATRADMQMTRFVGVAEGPIMGGSFDITFGPPPNPRDLLSAGPSEFTYGVQGGCSELRLGWNGYLGLQGDGTLCTDIEILEDSDPKGVFGVSWQGNHVLGDDYIDGLRVNLEFPKIGSDMAGYFADPYPLLLVVRTSVGSQLMEIAPPPPEDVLKGMEEMAEAISWCKRPMNKMPRSMDVLWLVDPPPYDMPFHLRFEDATAPVRDVVAQVTDLQVTDVQVTHDQPVEMPVDGGDELQVQEVTAIVQAEVAMSGLNSAAFGNRFQMEAGTEAGAAPDASEDIVHLTVDRRIKVDLSGVILGDAEAEFRPAEFRLTSPITRVVNVPQDQLPAGVEELSLVLELDPEQIAMQGNLEPFEFDETAIDVTQGEPADLCGEGVCGVGAAQTMVLMLLGLASMRRRRLFFAGR